MLRCHTLALIACRLALSLDSRQREVSLRHFASLVQHRLITASGRRDVASRAANVVSATRHQRGEVANGGGRLAGQGIDELHTPTVRHPATAGELVAEVAERIGHTTAVDGGHRSG